MKIVIVSSAVPRRCGLAAFTDDLRLALNVVTGWQISVCAIDRDHLAYGPEVIHTVAQDDPDDYRRAARVIADAATDLVVIQHEYGIFGGPAGAHVLALADELRLQGVRYAISLHTTLAHPNAAQRATLAALCANASRITAFSNEGRKLAVETGVAPADRVIVVPHGAPKLLRQAVDRQTVGAPLQEALKLDDSVRLLTTFGLVGPGKGLEYGIHAVKLALSHGLDLRYLIAGSTHPEIARREGETYRHQLQRLARRLGIADRVSFLDEYLTEAELSAMLARTDIFLTPYRSPEQICSGALTFALAAGRPVVSTAYRYAVEMLAPDIHGDAPGVVVPCGDAPAMAAAIARLLTDPVARSRALRAAHRLGATLVWPAVARRFADVFAEAAAHSPARRTPVIPPLNLTHLDRLVDEIGIVQFARGSDPVLDSGYCVDDMARLGLVAACLLRLHADHGLALRWLNAVIGFLDAALSEHGMHNLMNRHGRWLDRPHRGDHLGRTIWAAGTILATPGLSQVAHRRAASVFARAARLLDGVESPRTLAYGILGLTTGPAYQTPNLLRDSARRLLAAGGSGPQWPWYETILAYDNARLPQALLAAGTHLHDDEFSARALSTLDWYLAQVGLTGADSTLRLVGNGWRTDAGPLTAEGDEQPIDAAAVVEALIFAWQRTGSARYAELARRAFAWFHGANRAGVALYDPLNGGCADGLSATGVSGNRGAESTLAYHQALLALRCAGLLSAAGQALSPPSKWSITSASDARATPMAESAAP